MPAQNPARPEWTIPAHVVFQVLDGQAIVLNLDSGRYFGLNEVGTAFWQGLEQGQSLDQITEALLKQYGVEQDELHRDLVELVSALQERGLLVEVSESRG